MLPAKRSHDVRIEEDIKFSHLVQRNPLLLRGIEDSGYETPSPIQLKAIPLSRFGVDLIAQAKSGTGKTVVFGVMALESVNNQLKKPQVLMIAPTREIALQICSVVRNLGKHLAVRCEAFIGGQVATEEELRTTQIVIGTPGKLMALLSSQKLETKHISLLVLDEADKLMEENFQLQLGSVHKHLPATKRCIAFSATFTDELLDLLKVYMKEPHILSQTDTAPVLEEVQQYYMHVDVQDESQTSLNICRAKFKAAAATLSKVPFYQCIIFLNNSYRGRELADWLSTQGWTAAYTSSALDQASRTKVMDDMRGFRLRVLVCSDLVSRGIDIERVNLVLNMDFPRDVETYLHRVGRSGRFGTSGIAINLVGPDEQSFLALLRSQHIKVEPMPDCVTYTDYQKKLGEDEQSRLQEHQLIRTMKHAETAPDIRLRPESLVTKASTSKRQDVSDLQSIHRLSGESLSSSCKRARYGKTDEKKWRPSTACPLTHDSCVVQAPPVPIVPWGPSSYQMAHVAPSHGPWLYPSSLPDQPSRSSSHFIPPDLYF